MPRDLVEFLERHDGIGAFGVPEADSAERYDLSDFQEENVVMSVSMLSRAMDEIAELVDNGSAPEGILPFHVVYADEPLIRTALVLEQGAPNEGKVIAFNAKDLPSHRSPDELAHYDVIASSFTEWLHAWFESGFARVPRDAENEDADGDSVELPPAEPIVTGDIVTVDDAGYHWVTEIFEQYGQMQVRYETFATPDKRAKPPTGYPKVANSVYCRKVPEQLRAELLRLIPKEILSILPSARPREAQL